MDCARSLLLSSSVSKSLMNAPMLPGVTAIAASAPHGRPGNDMYSMHRCSPRARM